MSHYVCIAQLDTADRRKTTSQWTVFYSGNPRDSIIRRGPISPTVCPVGDENTAELIVGTFYEEVLGGRGIKYYDNKFNLEPNEEYLLTILLDLIRYESMELLKALTSETVTTKSVKVSVEIDELRSESSSEESNGKLKELETNYYELMCDIRKIKQELSELRTLIRAQIPSIVISGNCKDSASLGSTNGIGLPDIIYAGSVLTHPQESPQPTKYSCPKGKQVATCECRSCRMYKGTPNWCGDMERPAVDCDCECCKE